MNIFEFLFPPKVAWYAERPISHGYYDWTQCEIHNINETKDSVLTFHGGYRGHNKATVLKRITQKQLDRICIKVANTKMKFLPPVGKFVVVEIKDKIGYD